jgi:outer membrane protein assembly factor BamB
MAPDVIPAMPAFVGSMWGPMLCTLLLAAWWLVLGSASRRTRWAAMGLAILLAGVTFALVAANLPTRLFFVMKGIPAAAGIVAVFLCFAWALPSAVRWGSAVALGVLALSPWLIMEFDGTTGQFALEPHWRWRPNAEQQAVAFDQNRQTPAPTKEIPATVAANDWPAFRGPHQDGVVTGVALGDWSTPPKESWRRPVGSGWSSFCVVGDRFFTQEQRGEEELVACYSASTGAQLWATGDPVRYSDLPSGVGPRGTPTFHEGKLYTFGATAILNCLDAATGKRLWGVDLKEAVGSTASPFGFASSPLAVGKQIIVHPGSPTGPRLVAFDAETGKQLWQAGSGAIGYTSPHLATLAGVAQILVYSGDGLFGHDLASGKELWAYDWKAEQTAPVCVQPTLLPDDRIVLGGGRPGAKSRCVKPVRKGDSWAVEDVWESPFYPAFNDYVRQGDFLYGLEGGRMVCIDANTGKRRWKDGHYGAGQVLLAGDRLIVLAESGRLALVNPKPDGWQELRSSPALSDKTWNHPVIANGKLFIRNAREMVCYDLNR